MNVGTLTVQLAADYAKMVGGLARGAAAVKGFADQAKKMAREVAQVGAAISAAAGAAVAMAAQYDSGVASALKEVKDATGGVAVQIAKMLLPALHATANAIKEVSRYISGLTPEQRAQIAHWVEMAAAIGGVALVASKLLPLLSGLAQAFSAAFGALSAIGLPGLAIIIAIGVAIAVLHKAWRENWGGMQEVVKGALETISDYWQRFSTWLGGLFDKLMDQWIRMWKVIGHGGIDLSVKLGHMSKGDAEFAHTGFEQGMNILAAQLKSNNIGAALKFAAEKAKEGGAIVIDEWKIIAGEVKAAVRGLLPEFKKGAAVTVDSSLTGADNNVYKSVANLKALDDLTYDIADFEAAQTEATLSLEKWKKHVDSAAISAAESMVQVKNATDAAAEAWAKKIDKMAQDARDAFVSAAGDIAKQVASSGFAKLGEAGQFGASVLGGAQSGGIYGAIAAAALELLSMAKNFGGLVKLVNEQLGGTIKMIGPGLEAMVRVFGTIVSASQPLVDVTNELANSILAPLAAVFRMFAAGLKPFFSVVAALARPLAMLGPLLETLMPAFELLAFAVWKMSQVVGGGILRVFKLALDAWNFIIGGIANVVEDVLTAISMGNREFAKGFVAPLRAMLADTAGLQQQIDDLDNSTFAGDMASNVDGFSDTIENATEKVQEFTEALTNVPSWFKVNNKRFAAADGRQGSIFVDSGRATAMANYIATGNPVGIKGP